MIISCGTIFSSLMSERLTKKFGAGLVTAASVLATAGALFGFSVSGSFWMLCVWAVPYGLGAGAIDAALNNFVALHYSSRHMSWLHCCWGVGAAVSPYIMGFAIASGAGWSGGYAAVAAIQAVLAAAMFASLPLWKRKEGGTDGTRARTKALSLSRILRIKGVGYVLAAFFAYCALEATAGLWASSYLVLDRGMDADAAARFASMFYLGITAGRFVCGFAADRAGDSAMMRIGCVVTLAGLAMVWLPLGTDAVCLCGLVVTGLGCAPVYPSIIHSTPANFGEGNSQAVIGVQMASAYIGATFMPPLFGLLANHIGIWLYPLVLLILAGVMTAMTEKTRRLAGRGN
jgi:fucose permease